MARHDGTNPQEIMRTSSGWIDHERYARRARGLRSETLRRLFTGRRKVEMDSTEADTVTTFCRADVPCPAG